VLQQPTENDLTLFPRRLITLSLITLSRAFEKLGRANIRFVMSLRLPDCLSARMEQLRSHCTIFFLSNLISEDFSKNLSRGFKFH
jgi:hypothetical protein